MNQTLIGTTYMQLPYNSFIFQGYSQINYKLIINSYSCLPLCDTENTAGLVSLHSDKASKKYAPPLYCIHHFSSDIYLTISSSAHDLCKQSIKACLVCHEKYRSWNQKDTEGAIRSRKSKDRQYNCKTKKDERPSNDLHYTVLLKIELHEPHKKRG